MLSVRKPALGERVILFNSMRNSRQRIFASRGDAKSSFLQLVFASNFLQQDFNGSQCFVGETAGPVNGGTGQSRSI